jgi:hypothetical protein
VNASPRDNRGASDEPEDGWLDDDATDGTAHAPRANPDDPITVRPPAGARGPRPGPNFQGAQGRIAIVQGQLYLIGAIIVAQLFLCTTELYELLSGQSTSLWWIAGAQLVGFLVVLLVALWPRRRISGY